METGMHPHTKVVFDGRDIYLEPGPFNYWRLIRRSVIVAVFLALTAWDAVWFSEAATGPGFWGHPIGLVDGLKVAYLTIVAIAAFTGAMLAIGSLIDGLWRW